MSRLPCRRTLFMLFLCLCVGIATSALAQTVARRILSHGASGSDVAELQRRLQVLGFAVGPLDGIFGWRTRSAVRAFQREAELVVDGVAGAATLSVLARTASWQEGTWYTAVPPELESVVDLGEPAAPPVAQPAPAEPVSEEPVPAPDQTPRPDPIPEDPIPEEPLPQPAPIQPGPPQLPPDSPPSSPPEPKPNPVQPDRPKPVPVSDLPRPLVMGYYAMDWSTDQRSWHSFTRNLDVIPVVAPFQYRIDAASELIGTDPPLELMRLAGDNRVHVWAVIHNMVGGRFDAGVARAVLATPAARQRTVDRITVLLQDKGFTGVNIDIEAVPWDLRSEYTRFVEMLAARLRPLELAVSLAVPAKTVDNLKDGWSGAFDYAALGRLADYLMIMSYDEHSPGFKPGPIASLPWVRRVMTYAASQVPPERLLMGVAAYGYDWAVGTTQARGVTESRALAIAAKSGAAIQWDERAGTPFFHYKDDQGIERVVHYENARSMGAKLRLLPELQLRGIGLWRLGLEADTVWAVIRQEMVRLSEAPAPPTAESN